MKFVEKIPFSLEGYLQVVKVFTNGDKEVHFEDKNLIVESGRMLLLDQLFYTSLMGNPLSYAKFGTGGAIDIEGLFLKVPTPSMTDLYTPAGSAAITRTGRDPVERTISLLANIDNGVGNGLTINEAGFFTVDNTMFNIKVFPGILKNSSFSINLEWKFKLS